MSIMQSDPDAQPIKNITYKDIFHSVKNAIFLMDSDWRILEINSYATELTGYSIETLMKKKGVLDLIHPEDIDVIKEYHQRRNKGDDSVPDEYNCRIIHANGGVKWINIRVTPFENSDIKTITILDNTREYKNLQLLQTREKKFRLMIEHSHELIMNIDEDGVINYIGSSAKRIIGYETYELVSNNFFSYIHKEDRDRIQTLYQAGIEDDQIINFPEFRFRNRDGSWVFIDAVGNNMLKNEHIQGVVITGRDISEQKIAQEKALFYEHHDVLTGLPNRTMFLERLGLEIQQARRRNKLFAVMCIGMDRFKEVNDVYGPKTGDKIIKTIAMRLSHTFRDDDYVCRLTGDKFIVLLSDIHNAESATSIIRKALHVFRQNLIFNKEKLRVTGSIGVVFFPNDGKTDEQLITNAEAAMYMAKANGRFTYQFYDSRIHGDMMSRLKLERDLAEAIRRRELVDYYQPKVDGAGNIIGAECLIRWKCKERGIVLPHEFIPIAERNGTIVEIGYFMLKQACFRVKKWQTNGLAPIQVSVNLSPYQFRQKDLVEKIEAILSEAELESKWLELEITETGIMADEDESILKLKRLFDLGVSVSIDDFGTGYSSLNKLKDFPLTTLKIDKSFLNNLAGGSRSSTITTAIIGLAHDLDFKVVAEGVETSDQLQFLKNNKCDFFQGYLFDKPLPANMLEKRLVQSYKKIAM